MNDLPRRISRRTLGKLLVTIPAAATLAAEEKKAEKKPSDLAEFLAGREAGLSAEEKERLKTSVDEAEESLAVVRDFKLPPGVAPALRFSAMKSKRR